MQKIIFVEREFFTYSWSEEDGDDDETPSTKTDYIAKAKNSAALFKVVQLPRGSRETEVAVLIVFFCGEIIIKEMREPNVLLNFPLGPFSPRRQCRPSF